MRKFAFLLVLATLLCQCAVGGSTLTQIRDTLYRADGTLSAGSVTITDRKSTRLNSSHTT